MRTRKPLPPEADRTPQARLSEGGLHDVVGYQLAQASIVTRRVFDDVEGERGGLRRVEFTLLTLVQANPDVSARQLARALAMAPPNITVCLDKLEQQGLLVRARSTADARVQQLRVTRAGAARVAATMQQLLAREAEALGTLSAAERALLAELLHKVARAR